MRILASVLMFGVAACEAPDAPECGAECGSDSAADVAQVTAPDFAGIPDWRAVDPEDVLVIETRTGLVFVELAEQFAPNHAARMRQAARDGVLESIQPRSRNGSIKRNNVLLTHSLRYQSPIKQRTTIAVDGLSNFANLATP